MVDKKSDIAVIGVAVMGQNLILNMADNGYSVVAYNRTSQKVEDFLTGAANGYKNITGAYSIEEMVGMLEKPRKIMLMVKAGDVIDELIEQLIPHCEDGDCIIDGGNSHFPDTIRRTDYLKSKGLLFIGTGVSGGEEGARHGPSLMPGGNKNAWPAIKDLFQSISAKTNNGEPCCDWMGDDGAGHYVKMVHNGIEYGDMQIISEAYFLMRELLCMSSEEISVVFDTWNKTELSSYLIEITRDVLAYKDTDGTALVDKIQDTAGQKGTGKWTGIHSLDLGVPVTLISESVYARSLSALKKERIKASAFFKNKEKISLPDKTVFIEHIRKALWASKIISYAQGFMLLREASGYYKWDLDYGNIALVWRGGCIIRSSFLNNIKEAYVKNPNLENLLFDDYFKTAIKDSLNSWREVVALSVKSGIPVPALSAALSFFDGYRYKNLPANLLQAQRDYFGAHTYERIDKPAGQFFHTDWTGRGGDVSSTTYNA